MVSTQLIVIAGPPRSGTTLANRILCSSSWCAPFLPECSFISKQVEQYATILSYADEERFSAYFSTHEAYAACFRTCIAAHLESLIRASPHIAGYEHIVLKDPMLSYHLVQAQDLLPRGTHFIVTVRNPLAVIASMKQVATKRGDAWNIKVTVDEIFNFYFHLSCAREKIQPEYIHFVRYEDLVLRNWKELEAFLGFPVSGEFIATKHERRFNREDPFYSPLYEGPLSSERIDAWQDCLSDSEISYVRDIFGGVMTYWQYA
jgi:hypothetical protein